MKKLKCPECGQELRITSFLNGAVHGCMCDKCHIYGEIELWKALIGCKNRINRLNEQNRELYRTILKKMA